MKLVLSNAGRILRRLAVAALLVVFVLSWRESDYIHCLPEVDRIAAFEELSKSQTEMAEGIESRLSFLGRSLSSRVGVGLKPNASPATIQREVILADGTLIFLSAFGFLVLMIPRRRPRQRAQAS